MEMGEIRSELKDLVPKVLEVLEDTLRRQDATVSQKLKAAEMILSRVGPPKATVMGIIKGVGNMSPDKLIEEDAELKSRSLRLEREERLLRRKIEGAPLVEENRSADDHTSTEGHKVSRTPRSARRQSTA